MSRLKIDSDSKITKNHAVYSAILLVFYANGSIHASTLSKIKRARRNLVLPEPCRIVINSGGW